MSCYSTRMLYYGDNLQSSGLNELWVKAGVGDSTRFTPIHVLAERIGKDLCQLLPAVHYLTGCDYISKVGTKHAALKAHPETYLKQLGSVTDDLQSVVTASEAYLAQVLKLGTSCKTADELKIHVFHQSKNMCYDKLPPTSSAELIFWGHSTAHQMLSLLSPCPVSLIHHTMDSKKLTSHTRQWQEPYSGGICCLLLLWEMCYSILQM